ncbi:MAG: hypothetical protein V3W20_07010 [Candidatus Neomarinimicrobiota bacterium]
MTIVATEATLKTEDDLLVSLPLYAQIIEQPECGFFGVNNPADAKKSCREIWVKSQRDTVLKYLDEAQWEVENEIHYPLVAKWYTDEQSFWQNPISAKWGNVIEAGIKGVTDIALASVVDHATDPAVIGPIVTTVTNINEIAIFHPGSENKIIPSFIAISGGSVTINIPRCRMVTEALADNPKTGLAYATIANFEATVDVKREFNDPSVNAQWIWPHRCTANCSLNACGEFSQTACMYIRNNEIGSFSTLLAKFNSITQKFERSNLQCCSGNPEIIKINYKAGLSLVADSGRIKQAQDAVVRLAHSKMPNEVCGCQTFMRFWKRDRFIRPAEQLTFAMIKNPFGLSDGAWIAWQFANSLELVRGSLL